MMTWARLSVVGLSSTGLKSVWGGRPQASACSAWARPISPPSTVTAELSAMFCGLKGATRTPRRLRMRHRAATSVDLPASEVVPWTMRAEHDMTISGSSQRGRLSAKPPGRHRQKCGDLEQQVCFAAQNLQAMTKVVAFAVRILFANGINHTKNLR